MVWGALLPIFALPTTNVLAVLAVVTALAEPFAHLLLLARNSFATTFLWLRTLSNQTLAVTTQSTNVLDTTPPISAIPSLAISQPINVTPSLSGVLLPPSATTTLAIPLPEPATLFLGSAILILATLPVVLLELPLPTHRRLAPHSLARFPNVITPLAIACTLIFPKPIRHLLVAWQPLATRLELDGFMTSQLLANPVQLLASLLNVTPVVNAFKCPSVFPQLAPTLLAHHPELAKLKLVHQPRSIQTVPLTTVRSTKALAQTNSSSTKSSPLACTTHVLAQ
jgi:hypothetical protein